MEKSEKFITRITPNKNKWQTPSGLKGKCCGSKKTPLYEYEAGFGWEEWLFNIENRVNDIQYGFLECFNKTNFDKETKYNEVYLYTRRCNEDPNIGNFFLIAKINNLTKLSRKEAFLINGKFQDKISRMRTECKGDKKYFDLGPCRFIFNVKFKINEAHLFMDEIQISPKNKRFQMIELNINNSNHLQILDKIKTETTFIKIN